MTTFVFKDRNGRTVYTNSSATLFVFGDNPENPTYVYSCQRGGSSGFTVDKEQINRRRLDFVLEFLAEHGAWKVDFSGVDSIVFNNTIVVTAADLQAATPATPTVMGATLGDFSLQVARPK